MFIQNQSSKANLWILDRDEPWPGWVQETGETKKKKREVNSPKDAKGTGR